MNSALKIVISAAAATSAMTLFSYIASDKENENFSEPELLGGFLKKSLDIDKESSKPLGWASHYVIGIGFAAGYKLFLRMVKAKPSAENGILYGAAAGGAGLLWWKIMFENHPNPPKTHRKGFYTQLIIAHLIFGLTLSAFKNRRNR